MRDLTVNLPFPHSKQAEIVDSPAKRKCVRAGRRSGKTVAAAIHAVEQFLRGRRILYATPTQEQVDRFWQEVKRALDEPIGAGLYYKNETLHIIEQSGTEQRIKAKTAWDADTLRGDYADLLILDEYQDMKEEAWSLVGAPMLLDNNGDAIFIYTKKRGKNHTDNLFKRAKEDTTGRWASFVFSSFDNPHISEAALSDITDDMTNLAYRMEILAEDIEDDPKALWKRNLIDHISKPPELFRIVIGVDPPGGTTECGIIGAGISKIDGEIHGFVLADKSRRGSPEEWGSEAVSLYHVLQADRIVAETNFGGDMVDQVICTIDDQASFKSVRASRGKAIRAEPILALYEKGRVHHVGAFSQLEDEMCSWISGESNWSPNRIDALVWALSDLMFDGKQTPAGEIIETELDIYKSERKRVRLWQHSGNKR